jgi:hypothetical protein
MRTSICFLLIILTTNCRFDMPPALNSQYKISTLRNSNKIIKKSNDIPDILINYIDNEMEGFKIPDTSDFFANWNEFVKNDDLPFFCSTDFNGDEIIDYACILTTVDEYSVYIFLSQGESFKHYLIESGKISNTRINLLLSIEEKGEWETVDGIITVKNNALLINYVDESMSFAYTWNGYEFIKILFD